MSASVPRGSGSKVAAFAVGSLLLGQLPAALAFSLNPAAADDLGLDEILLPAPLLAAVWLVVYPCMGVAAWLLWSRRPDQVAGAALTLLVLGYVQSMSFWATDSLRAVAVVDATGLLLAIAAYVAARRASPDAAQWLLPWVVWMPITLAVKLATLAGLA